MLQDYIKKELEDKNRLVYFKSGRWMIHVFVWIVIYSIATVASSQSPFSFDAVLYILVGELAVYMIAYFCYCRYLIPGFFKRGKYLSFWLILVAGLLLLPAVNLVGHYFLDPFVPQALREGDELTLSAYGDLLANTLITFLALSFILYLMEIAEGIGTYRSVNTEIYQRLEAERQLLRTRMQPDFVMRSLDGIALLAERQNPGAPDALIGFSDMLRYRLYFNKPKTALIDELEQLQDLFRFQKTVMIDNDRCELAIAGDPNGKSIPAFVLINIAEALFGTYDGSGDWSLVFYLLVNDRELQLTIELQTNNPTAAEILADLRQSLIAIFNMDCTFTTEQEENNLRINICIPVQPL